MKGSNKNKQNFKVKGEKQKYMAKIIVLGNSAVGKTSILNRYTWNGQSVYNLSHTSTIGVDFKAKTIDIGDASMKLQLWDTAGQQKFRTLTDNYFCGSAGIVLVYSITDRKTFDQISDWMYQINNKVGDEGVRIILGNKCDVGGRNNIGDERRVVETYQGRMLAEKYRTMFLEVSAKENINIQQAFLMLSKKMLEKFRQNPNVSNGGVLRLNHLQDEDNKIKQKKCCS